MMFLWRKACRQYSWSWLCTTRCSKRSTRCRYAGGMIHQTYRNKYVERPRTETNFRRPLVKISDRPEIHVLKRAWSK